VLERPDGVHDVDPAHVLCTRSDGSAHEGLEGRQHLLEHPAAASEHEADARVADAHARLASRRGCGLPVDDQAGEEIVARGRFLGEHLRICVDPVIADSGAAHERARLLLGASHGLGEELGRTDAARTEDFFTLGRPALVEHARAGEVNDRVCAVDHGAPIAGCFRGPRDQLDLARAAAACRAGAETAAPMMARTPAEDDDVVTALAERHDERTPDESGSAADDYFQGFHRMP
jgi:hypothetical protein